MNLKELGQVSAVAVAVSTIAVSLYGVYDSSRAAQRDEDRRHLEEATALRDYRIKVTEWVFESLKGNNLKQQVVASSLVATLPKDEFRLSLERVLIRNAQPIVGRIIRADSVRKEIIANINKPTSMVQSGLAQAPTVSIFSDQDVYKFDVRYCDMSQHETASTFAKNIEAGKYSIITVSKIDRASIDHPFKNANFLTYNPSQTEKASFLNSVIAGLLDQNFSDHPSVQQPNDQFAIIFCGRTFE